MYMCVYAFDIDNKFGTFMFLSPLSAVMHYVGRLVVVLVSEKFSEKTLSFMHMHDIYHFL